MMFIRISIVCVCLFVLSGCVQEEPMPQIVYGYPSGPITKPEVPSTPAAPKSIGAGASGEWVPPSNLERKWTAIIIHHSGTPKGDAASFDQWHREGRHWEGVGYDFVIGNGNGSSDGEIETTFRWWQQKTGAHCGGTPDNWANEYGVGICLVGNFDHTRPTSSQMQSLVRLIRFLQNRYGIPKSRIYGHNSTPGAPGKTDCPGKNFSIARLKTML